MSNRVQEAKRYQDAIRAILLQEWDPIGVADAPEAHDEYNSYVPQIYALLIRREPASMIFDFLWWAETESMGLCGNRAKTAAVAERLAQIPSDLGL